MKKTNGFEWKDLSITAKNVLERCWFSVTSDVITSFTVPLGEKLYGEYDIVDEVIVKEILEFQKFNPYFDVHVNEVERTLFVAGAYLESEQKKIDNSLTELGEKEELEVGDSLYCRHSNDIANIFITKISKVLKNHYVLNNGVKIPKKKLTVEENEFVISGSDYAQTFYSRETVFLKDAYKRRCLIDEFEDLLDLRTISFEKLNALIDVLAYS